MPERFEGHAWTVGFLTFVSRISGLVREAVLSRFFGAGGLMDAFFFAFMLPNLFRRLFGEGALAAAFLPVYTELDRDDPAEAKRLATTTIGLLTILLGALVLAGEIVLFLVSRGHDHENVAVWLMMLTLPYMPMVCVVAILGAMLQVHGRFGPPAAASVVLNVVMITAAVIGALVLGTGAEERLLHVGVVAGSIILAGMLQIGWMLWSLRDRSWWLPGKRSRAPLARVMRQAGPMIVGLGVLQLNTFFDGLIASYPVTVGPTIFGAEYPLEAGAMATVSFAQRLYQFPLAVFGLAVATAIFPLLARQTNDEDGFRSTIRRGLRLVVFIGLPASLGLVLVREPAVAVILQGGAFTADDTRRVAFVLLGYAPAVWAYSMIHILARGFYARGEAKTPVKIAIGVVGLNLGLNLVLIWTPLKEAGLAWSTAICAVVQASLLLYALRRRLGAIIDRDVLKSWGRTAVVTAVMATAVWLVSTVLGATDGSWKVAAAHLAVLVATGAAVAAVAAVALQMPEWRWLIKRG